jgi:predicted transcriptional regulator
MCKRICTVASLHRPFSPAVDSEVQKKVQTDCGNAATLVPDYRRANVTKVRNRDSGFDGMRGPVHLHLSRRESQIMDIIYSVGEGSVADVVDRMPDDPGYNTVRNTMAILERKGHLQHRKDGHRYLYAPSNSVDSAKDSAVCHLLNTFFKGSLPQAVLAMLGTTGRELTEADLDEIARVVEQARTELK